MRLSEQAGWNQVAADWAYLLRAGTGFGIVEAERGLIATAIVLPYAAGFGWVSMVLVDRDARGRGLATTLLHRCLDGLHRAERTAVVDATPAGRSVYAGIGFRDAFGLRRLRGKQRAGLVRAGAEPAVRPVAAGDFDALVALDAAAFGASRPALLDALQRRMPHLAFVAERGSERCGFVLARDGRTATQLGPLVAHDAATAHALIAHALPGAGPSVILDVPDDHADLQRALLDAGFVEERPFTRMVHCSARPLVCAPASYAIAGPELG